MNGDEKKEALQFSKEQFIFKSVSSVKALVIRQIIIQGVSIISGIILARILSPASFGIFVIATFIVNFLSLFGDVGIGAAIVQRKEEPTKNELNSIFLFQNLLVIIIVAIMFFLLPFVVIFYPKITSDQVLFIRILLFSLIFYSMRTVPAMLLERKLMFDKIAIVEVVESIVFNLVAVILAFLKLDFWSFAVAIFCRGAAGILVLFLLTNWRPYFYFKLHEIKGFIKFGLYYQSNILLSALNQAVLPGYIGMTMGSNAVGYINWAQNIGLKPQQLINLLTRISFPAYSRIQDDLGIFKRGIERTTKYISWFCFPFVAIIGTLAKPITVLVYTEKWLPALPSLYLFLVSLIPISLFMIPLWSMLSLGKSNLFFKYGILTTFMLWLITIITEPFLKIISFPAGFLLVNLISIFFVKYELRKIVKIKILQGIKKSIYASSACTVIGFFLSFFCSNLTTLITVILFLSILYGMIIYLLEGEEIKKFIRILTPNSV